MNVTDCPLNKTGTETTSYILECVQSTAFIIIHSVVKTFTLLSTLFGNTLVLVSIVRLAPAVRGMNILIANLAVADLLVVCPLLMYPMELLEPTLSYDKYFCLTRRGIMLVSFTASLLTLTHISVDRFMGIFFTMKHFVDSKKKRLYITMVCLIWVTSIGIISSKLWFRDISPMEGIPCTNGSILSHELNITLVCGMFFLIIINTIVYSAIGIKLAFRKRNPCLNTYKIIRARMMIIVYAGYFLCWIPLFITMTIELVDKSRIKSIFCPAEYLTLTGYINSGINWLIYGLADKKFRNAFKMLLVHSRTATMQTPHAYELTQHHASAYPPSYSNAHTQPHANAHTQPHTNVYT